MEATREPPADEEATPAVSCWRRHLQQKERGGVRAGDAEQCKGPEYQRQPAVCLPTSHQRHAHWRGPIMAKLS